MNATTTILPRRSDSLTSAPSGSRSANSGAGAITLRCGRELIASEFAARSSWIPACAGMTLGFSCADAAEQSASVSASGESRLTASSVEEHVVRARRAGGRLGEVDREDGIELHPAVGTDVDEAQRVARRVVDAADRGVGEIEALAVVSDVHHVGLHHPLHRVVQAGLFPALAFPPLPRAAPHAPLVS